jgi:hypothetical protein
MDPQLRIVQEFQLEHQHGDGSWAQMEAVEHDSAAHDSERSWLRRKVFRCLSCNETVAVTTGGDQDVVVDEGAIR